MKTVRISAVILAAALVVALAISPAPSPQTAPDATFSAGDASRGKAVFEGAKGNCLSCHSVNGIGSLFGPDLSSIGNAPTDGQPRGRLAAMLMPSASANPQQLTRSILEPNAVVSPQNRYMTLETKDGKTIIGKLLSVDTFAYQILDSSENLANISKENVLRATMTSPMPSYRDKLTTQELADVVGYLLSLKGSSAPVTFDRLLQADQDPANWLTYSGNLSGHRFSPLTQINTDNAWNLELQWVWQAQSLEKFEATSLVLDGILYTVQAPNSTTVADGNTRVVALDAATGRPFWTFTYKIPRTARNCCGRVNRGLAVLGDALFMGTLNSHLIAINRKNGTLIWDTAVTATAADAPTYPITAAPLVVKDKVIIGTAGGDAGIRGFIAAFDARTGKEVWRFYTIPGTGEPGNETWAGESWKTGGAGVWTTGSYDPETNLTFWGTGNPNPTNNPVLRAGDNLYSNSVVALDADTGKLKWHYQFTPNDDMDYDSTQIPVLADVEFNGRIRKGMLFANRNGLMYLLDRTNGEFLQGKPFVQVNWMSGFDAKGRPQRVPGKRAGLRGDGPIIMPTVYGATNWYSPSYSPSTGLFYVPAWENTKSGGGAGRMRGATNNNPMGGIALAPNTKTEEEGYGVVRAFDPKTLDKKWEFKMNDITWAGVLSTAGDVVFSGGREGYFFALDARDGRLLWKAALGGQVNSGPMSYSVNGRQYVAVAAGTSLFSFALDND